MDLAFNPFTNKLDVVGDPIVANRVTILENTSFKVAYYAEITTTSGQIVPPENTTILLDQWANGIDAVLSEIEGGHPTLGDTGLDCTLDSSGNFTVSDILPSTPCALIYYIQAPLNIYNTLDKNKILEQVRIIVENPIDVTPINLKAISKITQVIPTEADGMVPVPEITQESHGIEVDNNGHITFNTSGFYRIQVQLNVDNTNNTEIDSWAEYFDGNNWVALPDSGNLKNSGNTGIGNFLVETTLQVETSLIIRLKLRTVTGSASLKFDNADGGIGVPSCTFIAYKLNPTATGITLQTDELKDNMVIGSLSDGNYMLIYPDGTTKLVGTAQTWDEVSSPLHGKNILVSAGRIDYNYEELTIDYSTTSRYPEEFIGAVSQFSHRRKNFSEIRPHLHWVQEFAGIPNILIAYRTCNNGENFTNWELKALTILDSIFVFTSTTLQQITEFNLPISVGERLGLSGTFECKIYRDSNNTSGLFSGNDTYQGNLKLKYYDAHFVVDTQGSDTEFTKYKT